MEASELLCCIVNHQRGSKVLKIAKQNGVTGGTIIIGKGTYKSKLLDFLDINDKRKEIVLMVAPESASEAAGEAITKEMQLHKYDHGIAFVIPISQLFGKQLCLNDNDATQYIYEGEKTMYQSIFTIVDKGQAENVISAIKEVGVNGGTIINARGSSIHETEVLFAMPIEPEREIVLVIVKREQVKPVCTSIRENLDLDKPGKGIMFVVPVGKTYGLHEDK